MRRVLWGVALGAVVLAGAAGWWVNMSGKAASDLSSAARAQQVPGMRMENFALRDTQSQRVRWEIVGDVAQVDTDADITRIEGVHLTLFSSKHGRVQVTAHRGTIHEGAKKMEVCGEVRLVVGQEFSLATDCLQWHIDRQALETDAAVAVRMGALQVEGQGFRGWVAEERFEVREQVLARWSEP